MTAWDVTDPVVETPSGELANGRQETPSVGLLPKGGCDEESRRTCWLRASEARIKAIGRRRSDVDSTTTSLDRRRACSTLLTDDNLCILQLTTDYHHNTEIILSLLITD
ncbi:hypothetical protein LSAT2_005434 [Lamellibrachia satsuma]|nr:hypothetical protein LSAT2_005434 [Lamellibrachia satsuma]